MEIPFPNKRYNIIYADPPWSYNDKMEGNSFSLDHEYETQSLEWIKSLPVQEISEKDCCLFLWATNPMLPSAIAVMESWGFRYKTLAFCWSKETTNLITVKNLGRWTMGSVELCFLATKGKPKRICKDVRQIVFDFRKKHSAKPPEVRDRIVKLMGDVPRIELFARERKAGWDAWGNEIESEVGK